MIQQNPKTYVFNYEAEVAAFYAEWPEMKGKLFFIDASVEPYKMVGGGVHSEEELKARFDRLSQEEPSLKKITEEKISGKRTAAICKRECGQLVEGYIVMTDHVETATVLGYTPVNDVAAAFTFDHEVGHAVCPAVYPQYLEPIADAYAFMRHFQRFVTSPKYMKRLLGHRALEIIISSDEPDHFSNPLIEYLLANRADMDFLALTPQQLAWKAYINAVQIMSRSLPAPAELVGKLNLLKKNNNIDIEDLVAFAISTPSENEFKWCSTAIRHLFNGEASLRGRRWKTGHQKAEAGHRLLNKRAAELARQNQSPGGPA